MKQISIIRSAKMLRDTVGQWRNLNHRIGLVPTMGALHKGHISLIEAARKQAGKVIVSVFVNPKQFGPNEDYAQYPRAFNQDRDLLADAGVDVMYAPDLIEMYPHNFATTVSMTGPARVNLEDAMRPTHFQGVTTVVTKLLLQSLPDYAFFGEKDYQQLMVIRKLVSDLDIPVHIQAVPTARNPQNLALSSRNQYLSHAHLNLAPRLYNALFLTATDIKRGVPLAQALKISREELEKVGFRVDYFEARHVETLAPITNIKDPIILLAAARLGSTRLIDNLIVERVNPDKPPEAQQAKPE
jgi:pantoate--beta-alanine ligase